MECRCVPRALPLVIAVALPQLGCAAAAAHAPTTAASDAHPHWSYSGDEGPPRWGDLDPSYALCKAGLAQSPVDLPIAPPRREPAPAKPPWDPVPLRITNNGHTIQVDDTASSAFVVDGTVYRLEQFHFHSPSEHTIGGRTYAVEMHLVHRSDHGKALVVAILFGAGAGNTILAPVLEAAPAQAGGPPVSVPGTTIDVSALMPSAPRFLRYEGSLTTPPCTEGVTWLVVEPDARMQMSPDQIAMLHDRTQPTTNRPVQAMGPREVVEMVP